MCRCIWLSLSLLLALTRVSAQIEPAQAQPSSQPPPPASGTIHGVVKAGNMPIPGAAVSISVESSSQKMSTWTDVDGSYSVTVPAFGAYTVTVQMMAFANGVQHVVVDASHQNVVANFEVTLVSRTHEAELAAAKADRAGKCATRISNPFRAAEHGWSGQRR